jgi:hypothetical protein
LKTVSGRGSLFRHGTSKFITYGNGFKTDIEEEDLSGTGWGLKFDFIIIHGHEWFANNIL